MHDAPSVSYPVGRSRFALGLALALAGIAAAVLAGWVAVSDAAGLRHAAAAAVLAACAAVAAHGWWRSPQGELAFGGAAWFWGDERCGTVEPVLDLQSVMLLRWRPEDSGAALWLWLEAGRAPRRWDALRRAVYSRATHAAPDAVAGAAEP